MVEFIAEATDLVAVQHRQGVQFALTLGGDDELPSPPVGRVPSGANHAGMLGSFGELRRRVVLELEEFGEIANGGGLVAPPALDG